MDTKIVYFLIPALLALAAALFEGISAGLLIPLARGVIDMDFSFVREFPLLKIILAKVPFTSNRPNSSVFILLITFVFTAVVLKNILQYISTTVVSYQLRRFSHNMRRVIFDRYLGFGKLFFDRSSLGYLHNILVEFTNSVTRQMMGLHQVLNNLFMLLVYIILMYVISWKLTILVIIVSPVFYYSLRWLIEKIKKTSTHYASAQNRLVRKISNILSCIPLIEVHTNEEQEKREFAVESERVAMAEFSMDKKTNLISPLQEIIMLMVILLLISAVTYIVIKEKRDVAGFLVYFYILKRAISALAAINSFIATLARIKGPFSEISKVLDDKDKYIVKEGKKGFTGLKNGIEFRHLNFSYVKETPVLKDITFSIAKGKVTAIVGPTGAGKTSLINLILRFYDCPPSSIFIDGLDISEFTLKSLRSHMALVSQETLLFNDTLRNNIAYGLHRDIKDQEFIEVIRKARLYDFIMHLSGTFNTLIGDRGVKLSGGEKQRVSIARVLLKGAEILFLDEATSSLDTRTEKLIQDAINEAVKGRTTVVIAHRLSTIKNSDKIVVIDDGRLIEEGPLNELLDRKGKFYEYWEEQKFY